VIEDEIKKFSTNESRRVRTKLFSETELGTFGDAFVCLRTGSFHGEPDVGAGVVAIGLVAMKQVAEVIVESELAVPSVVSEGVIPGADEETGEASVGLELVLPSVVTDGVVPGVDE